MFKKSILYQLIVFKFVIGCSIFASDSFAQLDVESNVSGKDAGVISEIDFEKLLNNQFSNLVTGRLQGETSSFASSDIKDASASLSISVLGGENSFLSSGSMLSISASGGYSDGLISIFNNSQLNSNIALGLQYNFFSIGRKYLEYDAEAYEQIRINQRKIITDYNFQIKKLLIDTNQILLKNNINSSFSKFQKAKDSVNIRIDSTRKYIKGLLESQADSGKLVLTKLRIDSLTLIHQIDSLNTIDTHYESIGRNLQRVNNEEIKKIDLKIDILKGFKFGWFSMGLNINNNSFNYLSEAANEDNFQISKKSSQNWSFILQYSYYRWSEFADNSFFLNGGATISYGDNFSTLSKQDISVIQSLGGGDTIVTEKYIAYKGNYFTKISKLKLFFNGMLFLKGNSAAIHLYPEIMMAENTKPLTNVGTGLFLSFKDSSGKSAVVNAEIYYTFLDIFNTKRDTKGLFDRNNIGLRFAFPLKFIIK